MDLRCIRAQGGKKRGGGKTPDAYKRPLEKGKTASGHEKKRKRVQPSLCGGGKTLRKKGKKRGRGTQPSSLKGGKRTWPHLYDLIGRRKEWDKVSAPPPERKVSDLRVGKGKRRFSFLSGGGGEIYPTPPVYQKRSSGFVTR